MSKRDQIEQSIDHHEASKSYFRKDISNNIRIGSAGIFLLAVGASAEIVAAIDKSIESAGLGLGALAIGGFVLKDAINDIPESIDGLVHETEVVARLESALERHP